MFSNGQARIVAAFFALALGAPAGAFAECGARPVNACELVNNDDEIFIGRVDEAVGQDLFDYRVRVVRSFRGTARGDIVVTVYSTGDLTAPAQLEPGREYLLFVSKWTEKGRVIRSTAQACGFWRPLDRVSAEEIAFLERLDEATDDGRVFGRLIKGAAPAAVPMPGVQVQLQRGSNTYDGTTDAQGRFEIAGLPEGTYRATIAVSDMQLDGDTRIELAAHGCLEASLTAVDNTRISGRLRLPRGIKVEGTQVTALSAAGGPSKTAVADARGDYAIAGLPPGDYFVGINIGFPPPRPEAPFLATYAPGTTDRNQAARITLTAGANTRAVDITVAQPAELVTIRVKGTLAIGTPAREQTLSFSPTGYGKYGGGKSTSPDGAASITLVRGVQAYILGSASGACLVPVLVGPDVYPPSIEATYSAEGCRQQVNLEHLGLLQASVRGALQPLPILVTYTDGRPASKAQVSIVSQRASTPFVTAFLTDAQGRFDMPLPLQQEFSIDASVTEVGRSCRSTPVLFNTDAGIRWQPWIDRSSRPDWNAVAPDNNQIQLLLGGAECAPR